jgi:hypothetical protein
MKHYRRQARWIAAALLALLVAAPAAAQLGDAEGEFRVNTTSPTKQRDTAAAFSPDGGFTVAWVDARVGITARFFPTAGPPTGDVVLVENLIFENNPGQGVIFSRLSPRLVYLDSGDFLLFWTEERGYLRAAVFHYDYDILEQDVFGQRFSADGSPVGRRFRVHRAQRGLQRNAAVAVDGEGGFLIAWDSSDQVTGIGPTDGVWARRFNARGLAIGPEIKLDEDPGVLARLPALAAGADGGFLAVWEGEGDGTDGTEVYGRLLDGRGQAVGPQFQLNTSVEHDQRAASVAAGRDGDYVVVWHAPRAGSQIHYRIFGQMVGTAGALLGSELQVSSSEIERAHALPRVTAAPSGEYLVAWLLWYGDFQTAVVGTRLDALGALSGEPFWISEHQTSSRTISLTAGPRGDFLAVWEGFTDGELGISARRVPGSEPLNIPGSPVVMLSAP